MKKMNSPKGKEKGKAVVVQKINEDGVVLFDPDNLPLGYIFRPNDIQLLLYLNKKIHHQPLPPNNIVQVNLYAHHPDQLAATYKAQGEKEWYYFTPRERKYTNGQRPKRSIEDGDGYWKATGAEQEIISREEVGSRKIIMGYKRALVFYQGSHPDGVKTNWIMHEFRLAAPTTHHHIVNKKRFDDYVICKVYKNNRSDGCSKRLRDDQSTSVDIASASKIPKRELNPAEANAQLSASPGIILQPAEEFTNYERDPYVNIPQRLQNHHQQQQQQQQQPIVQMAPLVSRACAVFPDNNLPDVPQAGEDVFLHRDSEILWDNQWPNNASSSSSNIPQLKHSPDEAKNQLTVSTGGMDWVELKKYWILDYDVYNPVVNIPHRLQNQHEQQHLQPTVQMPQVSSACAVLPQNNNLPILPPAGLDASWHRDSERLWDDQWTNDASSSCSKIPELQLNPAEANAQFAAASRGILQPAEEFTNYEYRPFVNIPPRLQNQQQEQPIVRMPQVSSACAVFPRNNLPVLPLAREDVFLRRHSERLWDEPTNDVSSSSSKIPELKHIPDEAENQLTVRTSGVDYVEEYSSPDYEYNPFGNIPRRLQNLHEQQQQQLIVPNSINHQVLPDDQNDYPVLDNPSFSYPRPI